jgi:hypothetical protein
MRVLFAMMDSDGDGTVSLQEFQAAHERIFKAMDTNKIAVSPRPTRSAMRLSTAGVLCSAAVALVSSPSTARSAECCHKPDFQSVSAIT